MPLPPSDVDRAAALRVFFAHQSVGQNILDGVRAIVAPRRLSWTDAFVGTNGQPSTKLVAFRQMMTAGPGQNAQFALFKFCYVDFTADTDVRTLYANYARTMGEISSRCPNTVIVHFTVPLTTVGSGAKAWVKRMLGRPIRGERENDKRHAYNEMLRSELGKSQPLFDLASIESGDPDHPHRYQYQGKSIPMLWSAYTSDGGHLNASGARRVGQDLLGFLANLQPRTA